MEHQEISFKYIKSEDFKLSPKEISILKLLVNGLKDKQIAEELNISRHTVNYHLKNIFQKLQVNTRYQAVSIAFIYELLK
ncbi:MAG: helix-turn-helix transcriptional regulator [Bacteroidota bacterium]|nr:helix-turn-helix transcriptional regulator [Bacteroidota bacterium]MDP4195820.1 helix-turn-helix transcriptional regulator [Bacteroidota bacterium]